MKKSMIILFTSLIIIGGFYFFFFVDKKKVINYKLLKIENNINGISVSTMESSKYISSYKLKNINDSSVSIDIYTTSIYNFFANKNSKIEIIIDEKKKILLIAGMSINRSKY